VHPVHTPRASRYTAVTGAASVSFGRYAKPGGHPTGEPSLFGHNANLVGARRGGGDNHIVFITIAVLLAIFVIPDPWRFPVIALAVLVEVAETFFWIRILRRRPVTVGAEALIGAMARVTTPCQPIGEVRVQGEVWRARCDAGADVGQQVRVRERDGLTLVVEHRRPID
jgi:membrane protein implicated in regulation of membrane protease activity